MKKIFEKIVAMLITVTVICASLPLSALAAGNGQSASSGTKATDASEQANTFGFIELNDGYVSVKVSTSNGGYYTSTVDGNAISKADDNSELIYSDSAFGSPYRSRSSPST